MSHLFLSTPEEVNVALDRCKDEMQVAEVVMALLTSGHEWLRLHNAADPSTFTQWTVMERDSNGIPLQIACDEFDGESSMIDNTPDEDDYRDY